MLTAQDQHGIQWRIDKDIKNSNTKQIRANVRALFLSSANGGCESLRRVVVELEEPTFGNAELTEEEMFELNEDQCRAMKKVLSAEHYALVRGMPGTGKTKTISRIVQALVNRGKTVLLTSYTNSAIDTILLKLLDIDVDFVRVGKPTSIDSRIKAHSLSEKKFESIRKFEEFVQSARVVATTCLSISHPYFQRQKFDYCIVDEASQIVEPVSLGPLRCASIFVLVGDNYQLPPLVSNPLAKQAVDDAQVPLSLFAKLAQVHPA